MDPVKFVHETLDFAAYLRRWENNLPSLKCGQVCNKPDEAVLISVDMINAFCHKGVLASERIASIIKPCTALLKKLHKHKLKKFLFTQDSHPENSLEFQAFPLHAVEGTNETDMIKEFKKLPFSKLFKIIFKKSISSFIGTNLDRILDKDKKIKTIIVIGNCTDLCLYQLAVHLKLKSTAEHLRWEIIVPADCAQTYDLPVKNAANVSAHPGDLFHHVFLYHLHLNGVNVVKEIV